MDLWHQASSGPDRLLITCVDRRVPRVCGGIDRRLPCHHDSLDGDVRLINSLKSTHRGLYSPVGAIGRPPSTLSGYMLSGSRPLGRHMDIIIRSPTQRQHPQPPQYRDRNHHLFKKSRGRHRLDPNVFGFRRPDLRWGARSGVPRRAPRPSEGVYRRLPGHHDRQNENIRLIYSLKSEQRGCTVPSGPSGGRR